MNKQEERIPVHHEDTTVDGGRTSKAFRKVGETVLRVDEGGRTVLVHRVAVPSHEGRRGEHTA